MCEEDGNGDSKMNEKTYTMMWCAYFIVVLWVLGVASGFGCLHTFCVGGAILFLIFSFISSFEPEYNAEFFIYLCISCVLFIVATYSLKYNITISGFFGIL